MSIKLKNNNNIECFIYCCMLLPFFIPQFFSTMIPHANILTYLLRLIAIAVIVFYILKKRNVQTIKRDYKSMWLLGIFLGLGITMAEMSRGDLISFRFFVFYTVCSLVACFCLSNKPMVCLDALIYLMGAYNVLQLLTLILYYPGGINHYIGANLRWTKAGAIYFLGGKNQAVFYMLLFMFCVALKVLLKEKRLPKRVFVYSAIFIVESYILDSSATLVCLLLWVGLYFLILTNWNKKLPIMFHPFLYFAGCMLILLALCAWTYATSSEILSEVLKSMGRDITFTGRTYIWEQALQQFYHDPLFGSGDVGYLITGQITHQAHNEYLNVLSKYGLIGFVPFLAVSIIPMLSMRKVKNSRVCALCSITFLIVLLHNCFDFMDHYMYIFFMCIFMCAQKMEEWQEKMNE